MDRGLLTRRGVLRGAGLATLGLSGCLAGGSTSNPPTSEEPTPSGPIRGEGPTERSASETESDPDIKYLPDTEEVRYVARLSGGGPSSTREKQYETTPFEDWAHSQCAFVAAESAREYAANQLDAADISGGVTSGIEGHDSVPVLTTKKVLNREGEVIRTPPVELSELVSVTPRSVQATYTLEDRSYERTAPVYAQFLIAQEQ